MTQSAETIWNEDTVFVSYAQNYEDVMLWRALKHVPRGFYLDVGAWSPDEDSITRAFYERGWRGLNLEPNLEWQAQLSAKRPEDINLPLAIADRPGSETFYFFANLGLSTLDAAVAERHMAEGWTAEPGTVEVTTLNAVWEAHVGGRDVHFLKIDVEGFEEQVLRGNDWRAHRPWIVVVESTQPMSRIESHALWEAILTDADYRLAYRDGLNRFYVAAEHAELLPALQYPPNVFDRFVRAAEAASESRADEAERLAESARASAAAAEARATEADARAETSAARADEAEARAQAAEARAQAAEARALSAEARAESAESQLHHVYHSKSWRWTAPLRKLKGPLAAIRLYQE
ncbi:MAG TPA: FkbM family methyltransferase [Oscillatoriaceae cyanobacterium]